MDSLKLDDILNIVNEEKIKKGLDNLLPLYPMLRVSENKLYIGVMLTSSDANVWDKSNSIKPEYWVLVDCNNLNVLEFNKTSEKDFAVGELIAKSTNNKQEEISKYAVSKTLQYQKYLMEDIKSDKLPIQKKLSNILNNKIVVDGEKVNIDDYIMANIESDIKGKVDELVNLVIQSKYSLITFYYDNLFNQVIDSYKKNDNIDMEKLKLCIEIMNNYYDGVVGIDNFFNI